ncbi:MAG: enoyl-CoA hydratase/isomerase family protein, partial [Rubrivivax sp.]
MDDLILRERDGTIATVTLNRPDKLNALTKPMWQRLGAVMGELSADDTVRCIVLRGAGGKAFAPGNDIGEFETERSNFEQGKAYGAVLHGALGAIAGCRHPVVALIEGICVGGGLEIAALCDIRICGEGSRFGVPINKLGLVMAHAELAALVRLAGRATALEILLEGRVFGAAEALDKRLVNRVVPDAMVEAEA